LLVLAVIVAGGWWAFGQMNRLGGATATELARLLGGATATNRAPAAAATPRSRANALGGPVLQATAVPRPPALVHTSAKPRVAVVAVKALTPVALSPLPPLPSSALLQNDYQVYETWNNCGPASLSMALSYFGIHESQAALANVLRPYQNDQGNNDDKDVTMDELAADARTFGLLAYHRPGGTMASMKRFIAAGMPVIAETVLTKDDDIGHFRVVKGYDDATLSVTQDDSMQGHNVQFSYSDFDAMWKKYNYEYLVLVPKTKQRLAEAILGSDLNPKVAWARTVALDRADLARDPSDSTSRFNLSVALYYVGDYTGSVREFEKVQNSLPFRTLWYQIEPIEAYYQLGDYQKVFALTDAILNNGNRAFSQLYILRGIIDKKQGNIQAARAEFENAVLYNVNLKAARDALRSVS
jgi:tetratricopeptide (TPR) repeat protein